MTRAFSDVDGDAKSIGHHCGESRMYRSLTAVVLCIFAQAALAQCAESGAALDAPPGAELVKKVRTAPAPVGPVPAGGELITTAAAATQSDTPAIAREDPAPPPG